MDERRALVAFGVPGCDKNLLASKTNGMVHRCDFRISRCMLLILMTAQTCRGGGNAVTYRTRPCGGSVRIRVKCVHNWGLKGWHVSSREGHTCFPKIGNLNLVLRGVKSRKARIDEF